MTREFAYPWALWALLLVPLLAALMFAPRARRARQGSFLFSRVDLASAYGRTWRTTLAPLPEVMKLLALGLIIVALARPQAITAEEVEVEGIDIYLALDMSGSMQAIDMSRAEVQRLLRQGKTPINRFDSAVATLKEFIQGRRYDRIGMVVFAQDAFLQFPLTLDYNTILNMLDRLRLGDIDPNGTAIGNALGRAVAGLVESDAKTKIVILITDGDRRGGNISPKRAAEMAKKADIKVFPILVGQEGAALVPAGQSFGGRATYQDRQFPIDPELLKEIAQITGGESYRATDAKELKEDLHEILDKFERTRHKDTANVEHEELYGRYLGWAIALLMAQFVLSHTLLRRFP